MSVVNLDDFREKKLEEEFFLNRADAIKEYKLLLQLADQYLVEAIKLQRKYDIEVTTI